jgi:hypothetical protein
MPLAALAPIISPQRQPTQSQFDRSSRFPDRPQEERAARGTGGWLMAAATKVIGSEPSECFQFQEPNTWYFSALLSPSCSLFLLMLRSYSWFEMMYSTDASRSVG